MAAGIIERYLDILVIPRYGHVGDAELHNEKIAYLWLWALKSRYFDG